MVHCVEEPKVRDTHTSKHIVDSAAARSNEPLPDPGYAVASELCSCLFTTFAAVFGSSSQSMAIASSATSRSASTATTLMHSPRDELCHSLHCRHSPLTNLIPLHNICNACGEF